MLKYVLSISDLGGSPIEAFSLAKIAIVSPFHMTGIAITLISRSPPTGTFPLDIWAFTKVLDTNGRLCASNF